MKSTASLLLMVLIVLACGQTKMKTPENVMDRFTEFIEKEKFVEDFTVFYPGVGDPALRPILTEKINLAAEDFMEIAISEDPSASKYHEKLATGLQRFSDIYLQLDTEDRERICTYFEELMDIVGLESSNGQLNDFMYNFDPTE